MYLYFATHLRPSEQLSSLSHVSGKRVSTSLLAPVGRAGLLTHSSSFRVILQVAVSGVLISHRTCSSHSVTQRFIFMLFSVFSIIALCDVVVVFHDSSLEQGCQGIGVRGDTRATRDVSQSEIFESGTGTCRNPKYTKAAINCRTPKGAWHATFQN